MNDTGAGHEGIDAFQANAKQTIHRIRNETGSEVLIRTPNPIVAVNGLALSESVTPGAAVETLQRPVKASAEALVQVADELGCPVVDHYRLWTQQSFSVTPPVANPNRLWPRMSDAIHPGALGHLVFYRELAPYFQLPVFFPWEVFENTMTP